jgi:hypothetical protein
MTNNRTLSAPLRRQLFQPFREKDIRVLLTVNHASFATPYRFVSGDPNEFASIVSNSNTFLTFPFMLDILSDEDAQPQAIIRIQNADDRIGSTLMALPDDTVQITIQLVMRETPNVIEYEATGLELVDVQVNAMEITGTLLVRGYSVEPCPGRKLTNTISPVIFR